MITSHYLKAHTREAHQRTERLAGGRSIMGRRLEVADYHELLLANYQVWSNLDQHFALLAQDQHQVNWKGWQMANWKLIRQELPAEYTAATTQNQPSSSFLVDDNSAWGALYVLRGSALGSQYILRALETNPQLTELGPFLFYQTCAGHALQWDAFCEALNQVVLTPAHQALALSAANATFNLFAQQYQHLSLNRSQPQ